MELVTSSEHADIAHALSFSEPSMSMDMGCRVTGHQSLDSSASLLPPDVLAPCRRRGPGTASPPEPSSEAMPQALRSSHDFRMEAKQCTESGFARQCSMPKALHASASGTSERAANSVRAAAIAACSFHQAQSA